MIRRPPRSTQSRSAASDVYKRQGKGKAKGAGCCGGADVAPDGKIPPPDPVGMDRSCTDILFLLIFMAFWFGMIVCASMGFSKGDIDTLFYFIDYQGNKCGKNGLGKYVYFTHPTNTYSNICVNECPSAAADSNSQYAMYLLNTTVTSTSNLGYTTSQASSTTWENSYTSSSQCLSETKPPTTQNGVSACGVYASTAPNGLYFCIPDDMSSFGGGTSAAGEILDGFAEKIKAAVADLITGWWILLSAAVIALIVSFMWIQLLKYCAGCFVWSVLIGSVLITAVIALFGYLMYVHYSDEYDKTNLDTDKTLAWTFLVLCGIFAVGAFVLLCMVICLCKKIRIAIGIVKEACEAVTSMPLIVLFPLCQYAVFIVFAVYWVVVAAFMVSTGTVGQEVDASTGSTIYSIEFEDDMTKAILYHFFGLLWNMAFFRHFTICVIAGAVGSWYWTPYIDGDKKDLPTAPVTSAVWRTFRYHVGTIAFGSFIIAVIEFIQCVVEYIKKKYLKEGSWLACLASYIECCLECFKRVMEFISRNAYIITACKGKNFCSAAFEAFNYILDNLTQVAAVTWISAYLMFLGKVFIVLGTVMLCYLLSIYIASDDLNSVILLLVVCALLAYAVACMFLSVFETAIDTILMCFCWESSAKGSFSGGYVYATEHLNCFIEGINVETATSSAAHPETTSGGETAEAK
eukprot:TRINITY_DN276_c0_g1_i5.p1 TRINITY_DN276_c0_g1~~TRINITY_DN276_c0_g1_i5.p1  ORF type:complete len:688 (-),score=197.76 TRINITY_DN276_c0_g1_i5:178-2241(-)